MDISASAQVTEALAKAKMSFNSAPIEIVPGVRTSGEVPRVTDFEPTLNFLREEEEAGCWRTPWWMSRPCTWCRRGA